MFLLDCNKACLLLLMDTLLKEQDFNSYLGIEGSGAALRLDRNSTLTIMLLYGRSITIFTCALKRVENQGWRFVPKLENPI